MSLGKRKGESWEGRGLTLLCHPPSGNGEGGRSKGEGERSRGEVKRREGKVKRGNGNGKE